MDLDRIYHIKLDEIEIGDENVRRSNATEDLEGLAISIKKNGQLQPVVVSGIHGKPPYSLISGQRRYLACKKILKYEKIYAVFVGKLSKSELIIKSLVENMQRVGLEYGDTARAVTFLFNKFKSVDRVHDETGLTIRKINEFLLIESQASDKMKVLIKEKKVSVIDVKRALRAAQDNIVKAEELLEQMALLNLTNHEKKRVVEYGLKDKNASAKKILAQATKPQIEEKLLVRIPIDVRKGFAKAAKQLEIEADELASKVIADWVHAQGFAE